MFYWCSNAAVVVTELCTAVISSTEQCSTAAPLGQNEAKVKLGHRGADSNC